MNLTVQFILNTLMLDSKCLTMITLTVFKTETETVTYNITKGFDAVIVFTNDSKHSKILDLLIFKNFIISVLKDTTKYTISIDEKYYDIERW